MSTMLRVFALFAVVGLALLAAGCGAGGSTGTAGAPVLQQVGNLEKTSLNVAVLPDLDSAGFFVALHEGLFAREGLDIHYTPSFNDDSLVAQVKGQVDISGLNYVSYIQMQATHAADLDIFAEGSLMRPGNDVVMVMPHSKVQSLKELKGHVLGVNTTENIGFLLVASMLSQNGLAVKTTPAYSANDVMLPGDPAFPFPASKPLISGQVSAAIMPEPFATQLAEQDGASIIADADSGGTSQFPILGYAVTKAWARANPDTLKAFDAALEAGQRIADTNRAAVEAAYIALPQGEGHVDPVTAAQMALSDYPLGVTPVRLQRVANVMQQFGFLKQQFSIQQMLN